MSPLTVTQLAQDLYKTTDVLRGGVDTSTYLGVLSGMLLLKRVADQPDILYLPEESHWSRFVEPKNEDPRSVLSQALLELERRNPEVLEGVLETLDYAKRLRPATLAAMIDHLDRVPLGDSDMEFSDVVGRAYDTLLGRIAEGEGKRGGEFFTPRSVAQLMVELVQPEEGQSVYDPFVGSAGMLLEAKKHVDELSGQDVNLTLFGQEINGFTWAIARLNLLLHGITDSSLLCGDTLAEPLHMDRARGFHRVLTNPPFAMSYTEEQVRSRERMSYGWTPEKHKADLMNVQHVLAMLRPDGTGAVVTPHGVLFRGGAEASIRRGIVEDSRLEAVVGIGPNVFHGTSIPACVLVLRGTDGPPPDRRGSVLFVNAEREVITGRSQNYLAPQHIAKIADVFHKWSEVPGFSRVVPLEEIRENDFNLNIGRYVDNSPPAEPPLDVHAALFGGIPRKEVTDEAPRFHAFGIDPIHLFRTKGHDYLDFPAANHDAIADRIREDAAAKEQEVRDCFRLWWEETAKDIAEYVGTARLLKLRSSLVSSFEEKLLPTKALDRRQLIGVFATWWSDRHDDLRSLDSLGFPGVIVRWGHSPFESEDLARERVLDTLGEDLQSRVVKLVATERETLVATYRSWCDRYATSLADLEVQREAGAARLRSRLVGLGYEDPGDRH